MLKSSERIKPLKAGRNCHRLQTKCFNCKQSRNSNLNITRRG